MTTGDRAFGGTRNYKKVAQNSNPKTITRKRAIGGTWY